MNQNPRARRKSPAPPKPSRLGGPTLNISPGPNEKSSSTLTIKKNNPAPTIRQSRSHGDLFQYKKKSQAPPPPPTTGPGVKRVPPVPSRTYLNAVGANTRKHSAYEELRVGDTRLSMKRKSEPGPPIRPLSRDEIIDDFVRTTLEDATAQFQRMVKEEEEDIYYNQHHEFYNGFEFLPEGNVGYTTAQVHSEPKIPFENEYLHREEIRYDISDNYTFEEGKGEEDPALVDSQCEEVPKRYIPCPSDFSEKNQNVVQGGVVEVYKNPLIVPEDDSKTDTAYKAAMFDEETVKEPVTSQGNSQGTSNSQTNIPRNCQRIQGEITEARTKATTEATMKATTEVTTETTTEATVKLTEEATVHATKEITKEVTMQTTKEGTNEDPAQGTKKDPTETIVPATKEATVQATVQATEGDAKEATVQATKHDITETTVECYAEPITEVKTEPMPSRKTDKVDCDMIINASTDKRPKKEPMPDLLVIGKGKNPIESSMKIDASHDSKSDMAIEPCLELPRENLSIEKRRDHVGSEMHEAVGPIDKKQIIPLVGDVPDPIKTVSNSIEPSTSDSVSKSMPEDKYDESAKPTIEKKNITLKAECSSISKAQEEQFSLVLETIPQSKGEKKQTQPDTTKDVAKPSERKENEKTLEVKQASSPCPGPEVPVVKETPGGDKQTRPTAQGESDTKVSL